VILLWTVVRRDGGRFSVMRNTEKHLMVYVDEQAASTAGLLAARRVASRGKTPPDEIRLVPFITENRNDLGQEWERWAHTQFWPEKKE